MVSVTSDIASTLAPKSARSKSARDDLPASADQFGTLVSRNSADPAPSAQPDITAPAPRRDDRSTADRPRASDRRDDRAAASQDRRTDAKPGTERPDTAKRADDKAVKSDQASDSKSKPADETADPKAAASDTETTDGTNTDAAEKPVTLEMVAIAVPISAPSADATVAPATPDMAGNSQPLAIAAAAALKAKLDAGATTTATGAEALPSDMSIEGEQNFAALIASATAAAPKGGKKTDAEATATATSTTDAKADGDVETITTSPSLNAPAPASKPVAEVKSDPAAVATRAPEAAPADGELAKAAAAQHKEQRAEQAPQTAAPDLTNTTPAPQQQTHLQAATNAAAVAPQANMPAAANPPVPLSGVAVEIAQSAKAGKTSFDIRLDPAELGRIDVRLEVDKHGNVTSHLTVEKPETLTMLRQDAPQLQRALEQAGLKTNDSGLQFSLRDQSQQQQQQSGEQSGRHMHRLTINDDDTVTVAPAARGYGRMYGANGGVDISI
ncbi:flagellar hook-length control protein FliK [Tardiphaga alba]|uniref:Flagellar hook-length control protein FliK n=1 Tax=Tardiphaga alba TaxID=340268 RepID=A0ABX8A4P3_9BRAD|nr:flagellar hook-length control protein FliK [Tardiphaga alba]QUS38517.1 flagellar hook-length control protein FliK [Tardiphaga alba]